MSERIHLFSNGSQYLDWTANNCDRCTKAGDPSEAGSSKCELFEAMHDAATDDGTVTPAIANRIGLLDAGTRYVWACPELHLPGMARPLAEQRQRDRELLRAWNAGEPIR
jgi:hypothetical protein